MFSQLVALLLAAFHLSGGAATDGFLAAGPEPAQPHDRAQAFLNDLEQVHDSQLRVTITSLLPILASVMEPTLASMPRNPRGALSSASTRYALHTSSPSAMDGR